MARLPVGAAGGQVWRSGPRRSNGGWLRATGAWGEQRLGLCVCCVEDHLSRLFARAGCEQAHVGTPCTAGGLCSPSCPCPSPAVGNGTQRPVSILVPSSHRGPSPTTCSPWGLILPWVGTYPPSSAPGEPECLRLLQPLQTRSGWQPTVCVCACVGANPGNICQGCLRSWEFPAGGEGTAGCAGGHVCAGRLACAGAPCARQRLCTEASAAGVCLHTCVPRRVQVALRTTASPSALGFGDPAGGSGGFGLGFTNPGVAMFTAAPKGRCLVREGRCLHPC